MPVRLYLHAKFIVLRSFKLIYYFCFAVSMPLGTAPGNRYAN